METKRGWAPVTATDWAWLGGAVGVIVGAFLPWVEVGYFTKTGIEGDGVYTLIAGVVTVACYSNRHKVGPAIAATLIMAGTFVLAMYDTSNIAEVASESAVGGGLSLTLIAAIVGTIGAFVVVAAANRPATRNEPPRYNPEAGAGERGGSIIGPADDGQRG